MAAKGTRVTQKEKERMLELYNMYGSFKKVAAKMRRCPDTVSRYVHELQAAYAATMLANVGRGQKYFVYLNGQ